MAEDPSRKLMCLQLVSTILMGVALGGMLLSAFESWLRGNSFVWWLGLSALFAFTIAVNTARLLKRMI
jgi:hypothetical protein